MTVLAERWGLLLFSPLGEGSVMGTEQHMDHVRKAK